MASWVTVEGPTLEACQAEAARQLRLTPDAVEFQVIQHGRRGFFVDRPFRIMASGRAHAAPAKEGAAALLSKLDIHYRLAMTEMARPGMLQQGTDGKLLDEVLASFDKLSDERRKEVVALSPLLSGDAARRIQECIAKDGWARVLVAPDRMSVTLDAHPPEGLGKPVGVSDVLARMMEERVTHGVDPARIGQVLEEVAASGRPAAGIVVAQGRPPRPGVDGELKYLVELPAKETVLRADDSADYRGRARICAVKADTALARLIPPSPGEPGLTVRGESLPTTPGRPATLAAGENVTFDPKTGEYHATIDGLVDLDPPGHISVRPVFVVNGDVDMSTGNIEFNGMVQVAGTVRDGFSVHATGNIDIRGGVEGCEIISEQGNVRVHQGIAGRRHCFVSAGGDVEARYIENARVWARNDVKVDVAIMHSEVVAGNSVLAPRGRGAIIGGSTRAADLIHARILGASNEPVTECLVGISLKQQDQLRALDQRLTAVKRATARLEELAKEFELATRDSRRLPERDQQHYLDIRKQLLLLHYEMDKVEARRQDFIGRLTARARGVIKVSSEAHGKVVVHIGRFVDQVSDSVGACIFRFDPARGHIVRDRYTA